LHHTEVGETLNDVWLEKEKEIKILKTKETKLEHKIKELEEKNTKLNKARKPIYQETLERQVMPVGESFDKMRKSFEGSDEKFVQFLFQQPILNIVDFSIEALEDENKILADNVKVLKHDNKALESWIEGYLPSVRDMEKRCIACGLYLDIEGVTLTQEITTLKAKGKTLERRISVLEEQNKKLESENEAWKIAHQKILGREAAQSIGISVFKERQATKNGVRKQPPTPANKYK
jgi:cell division protein FtsB